MSANFNDVSIQIRKAGPNNVRVTPMAGQHISEGLQQIEVNDNGTWRVIAEGLPHATATTLVSQATNRVICG